MQNSVFSNLQLYCFLFHHGERRPKRESVIAVYLQEASEEAFEEAAAVNSSSVDDPEITIQVK